MYRKKERVIDKMSVIDWLNVLWWRWLWCVSLYVMSGGEGASKAVADKGSRPQKPVDAIVPSGLVARVEGSLVSAK